MKFHRSAFSCSQVRLQHTQQAVPLVVHTSTKLLVVVFILLLLVPWFWCLAVWHSSTANVKTMLNERWVLFTREKAGTRQKNSPLVQKSSCTVVWDFHTGHTLLWRCEGLKECKVTCRANDGTSRNTHVDGVYSSCSVFMLEIWSFDQHRLQTMKFLWLFLEKRDVLNHELKLQLFIWLIEFLTM